MKIRVRRQVIVTVVALTLPSGAVTTLVLPTSMVAIAHAACPPDCGGGPGNGGTPSGPPAGGTEFRPPEMAQLPGYQGSNYGSPKLDQNNGVSIYNQSGQAAAQSPIRAAQQVSQPAQYQYAANGEQQPIAHEPLPTQELSQEFKDAQAHEAAAEVKEDTPSNPGWPPSHPGEGGNSGTRFTFDSMKQCQEHIAALPASEQSKWVCVLGAGNTGQRVKPGEEPYSPPRQLPEPGPYNYNYGDATNRPPGRLSPAGPSNVPTPPDVAPPRFPPDSVDGGEGFPGPLPRHWFSGG